MNPIEKQNSKLIAEMNMLVLTSGALFDDSFRQELRRHLMKWLQVVVELDAKRINEIKDAVRDYLGDADLGEVDLTPEEQEKLETLRDLIK